MTSLVDTHVHLYGVFQLHRAFDGAVLNFRRWKDELGLPRRAPSILLLAETAGDDVFGRLRTGSVPREHLRSWSVAETGDQISLFLTRDDDERLIVVAGRQMTTTEGVELLALACTAQSQDRHPLLDMIAFISSNGGQPVLPWGFGKWTGKRGRLVEQILESSWATTIALGDTSYRPRTGRLPLPFRKAHDHGIPIYPGTDPLPFAGQESKIGRYGLVLREELDLRRPGFSLRGHLLSLRGPVERYGAGEPFLPSLGLQLRMQLWKPGPRAASSAGP